MKKKSDKYPIKGALVYTGLLFYSRESSKPYAIRRMLAARSGARTEGRAKRRDPESAAPTKKEGGRTSKRSPIAQFG